MSGHQPFSKLTANFSKQRQKKIEEKTNKLKEEMALNELRQAFQLSQAELANKLNVEQPAISNLEQRSDIYISHLRQIIETMGGKLEITAKFDDREIEITNFNFSQ